MSSQNTPRYLQLQEEEELSPEFKELISGLPTEKGWFESSHLYQYQGFWYQPDHLQALISCRKKFKARDSDVFLVTYPKCGTTWLKAIIFALLNRQDHPPAARNHPLLTHNPHQLVLSLEINLYADANQTSTSVPVPVPVPGCRRFLSTHMPHVALPESVKSKKCKVVYGCRDPRDAFVSLWHFMNKLRPGGTLEKDIQEALDKFCGGAVGFGPFWDHVLEYWKQSRSRDEGSSSSSVHFVKYEDMKEKPGAHLRRLAEFLDCPFSEDEEEEGSDSGVVDQILGLTSFETMKSVEVNRSGRLENGMENRHFFRKGEVGDWNNYLSHEMAQKLHHVVQHKLSGSGLVL